MASGVPEGFREFLGVEPGGVAGGGRGASAFVAGGRRAALSPIRGHPVEVDGDFDQDLVIDDRRGGVSEELQVVGACGVVGFVGPLRFELGNGVADRDRRRPVMKRHPCHR